MGAPGDWRFAAAANAMMVATSSLAVAIGLLAMLAGRPVDTDIAPVPETSRSGADPLAREVREPGREPFTPPPDTKSDRLPEEAALARKAAPPSPEPDLGLGQAADETVWDAPLLGGEATDGGLGAIDFTQP